MLTSRTVIHAGPLVAFTLLLALSGSGPSAATAPRPGIDWPQFRGIRASGTAEGYVTPAAWNVARNDGVGWKVPIAGLGHSSPIVWGDLVCVTSAISGRKDAPLRVGLYGDITPVDDDSVHEWRVSCLDKKDGRVRWQHLAHSGVPKIKRHTKATHANSTLATDGEHLVAYFGSEGLYTYDLKGTLLWKKDLGVLDAGFFMVPAAQWGTASSPIIHDGVIVIQADVQKGSFLAAFDVKDGRERWRTAREDVPTWSTPTVHEVNGRTQLIVNGWHHIGAYDFRNGKEIWKMKGGGDIPVPTPVVAHGLIVITNAHGAMAPVYAVRENASGDVTLAAGASTNAAIAWSYPRDGAYMVTPLVYRDLLYVAKNNGALNVYDVRSGEKKYQQRLGDGTTGFSASPVAGDGKVYFTSEDGHIYVLKAGPVFELLAVNEMEEICMATPAISEGTLFFRTRDHAVAIRRK